MRYFNLINDTYNKLEKQFNNNKKLLIQYVDYNENMEPFILVQVNYNSKSIFIKITENQGNNKKYMLEIITDDINYINCNFDTIIELLKISIKHIDYNIQELLSYFNYSFNIEENIYYIENRLYYNIKFYNSNVNNTNLFFKTIENNCGIKNTIFM